MKKLLLKFILCGVLLCMVAGAAAAQKRRAVDSINHVWFAASFAEQKELKQAIADFRRTTSVRTPDLYIIIYLLIKYIQDLLPQTEKVVHLPKKK